jgi:hypothetical protein
MDLTKNRLYELGSHSDIIFEINGRIFKAHKCILSARSAYFKKKFENNWKNRSYIIGTHEEVKHRSLYSEPKSYFLFY